VSRKDLKTNLIIYVREALLVILGVEKCCCGMA